MASSGDCTHLRGPCTSLVTILATCTSGWRSRPSSSVIPESIRSRCQSRRSLSEATRRCSPSAAFIRPHSVRESFAPIGTSVSGRPRRRDDPTPGASGQRRDVPQPWPSSGRRALARASGRRRALTALRSPWRTRNPGALITGRTSATQRARPRGVRGRSCRHRRTCFRTRQEGRLSLPGM